MAGKFWKILFDHRSSILKKYYVNMSGKYSVGADKMFSVSFLVVLELILGCFWADFWSRDWEIFNFCLEKVSPSFTKASLVSMRKTITENHKNVSTDIIAATFENEIGSEVVSGERVWSNHGFFNARKWDYLMEKINIPENILLYINQSYLTVNKHKKIFYFDFFLIANIVASLNSSQGVSSHTLKENEVKMVMPRYDPKTSEFKRVIRNYCLYCGKRFF